MAHERGLEPGASTSGCRCPTPWPSRWPSPGRAGARLGQVQRRGRPRVGSGLGLALGLTLLGVQIRPLYLVAGAAALLAAPACLGIPRAIKTPGAAAWCSGAGTCTLLRRCNFLEGWRKQIALAFAGFLLVKRARRAAPEMIVLSAGIQAVGYVLPRRAWAG